MQVLRAMYNLAPDIRTIGVTGRQDVLVQDFSSFNNMIDFSIESKAISSSTSLNNRKLTFRITIIAKNSAGNMLPIQTEDVTITPSVILRDNKIYLVGNYTSALFTPKVQYPFDCTYSYMISGSFSTSAFSESFSFSSANEVLIEVVKYINPTISADISKVDARPPHTVTIDVSGRAIKNVYYHQTYRQNQISLVFEYKKEGGQLETVDLGTLPIGDDNTFSGNFTITTMTDYTALYLVNIKYKDVYDVEKILSDKIYPNIPVAYWNNETMNFNTLVKQQGFPLSEIIDSGSRSGAVKLGKLGVEWGNVSIVPSKANTPTGQTVNFSLPFVNLPAVVVSMSTTVPRNSCYRLLCIIYNTDKM